MRTRIRPTTWDRYRGLIVRHVQPRIGSVKLADLKPRDVQRVVDEMLADGAAPRSVVQCYRVMSSALRQAVRWQLIATNPAAAVQPPRPTRPEITVPNREQLAKIIAASKGTPMELPVLIAASTGMRRGEVAGLRWADIEETPDGTVARVTGTLQRIDGEPQARGSEDRPRPPHRGATRAVSWKRSTLTARNRPNVGSPSDLVGPRTTWSSNAVTVSPTTRTPSPTCSASSTETAGVRGVRFHDLRHAYATALLRRGVHPKVVSEALGHASTSFTMDTYTHVVPSMQRAAADAIEEELG